jgi:hypothetical protein
MIYFLINNTFHLHDVSILANDLCNHEIGLIQIPYSLNPIIKDDRFSRLFVFDRMTFLRDYHKNWPIDFLRKTYNDFIKAYKIRKSIMPSPSDFLFVFTEAELLNQIIIHLFKKRGATIYLVEDGAASSIYYNIDSDRFAKKTQVIKWLFKLLYSIKGFNPFIKDGYFYPMMSETYFKALLVFFPVTVKRSIPVIKLGIRNHINHIKNRNSHNAVFLSQPIVPFYCSEDEYLFTVDNIFSKISRNFEILYLKFHPDELKNEFHKKTLEISTKYKNIIVLESENIIEDTISRLDICCSISFISTALRKLTYFEIEPVYLFHLYNFFDDEVSKQLYKNLKYMGYNFLLNLEDIKPGYKSGILDKISNGITIAELVE